ncbi:DUF7065 domain-containing protein [Nocardia jinanensis]|uniref:Uncharacterized protein n=1 Tax=Nocardia jinanensis TaxID=382504 RepID=A0A917RLC5_9NOCA|nr:hypothetical protein [Nocardia jinanensis]GGL13097.1 hypothetical protein GCM10011588_29400 [Nocardia jinanensis]
MNHSLTPLDDMFHPPTDDPWWTETVWFSWIVPERGLVGYVYPVFRPNVGTQFGGVVVFGDRPVPPWEEPVHAFDWHQPIPPGLDLRDMTLASGLTIRVESPGEVYSVQYSGRDLELELTVRARGTALVTRSSTPPLGAGHIDQMCHVTGHMVLDSQKSAVDCLAIRDRAWGSRRDGRQPRVSYSWGAASADEYFLAAGVHRDGIDTLTTGFLMRDGRWSPVISGRRRTVRGADGQVTEVEIAAVDELGRELAVSGRATPRHLFEGYPGMICWTGLVEWNLDGQTAWGEDQDVWSPGSWRRHRLA